MRKDQETKYIHAATPEVEVFRATGVRDLVGIYNFDVI